MSNIVFSILPKILWYGFCDDEIMMYCCVNDSDQESIDNMIKMLSPYNTYYSLYNHIISSKSGDIMSFTYILRLVL